MNRYWVNGLFQNAEPTTDAETSIHDAMTELNDDVSFTGNQLTTVEAVLRRVITATKRDAIRGERATLEQFRADITRENALLLRQRDEAREQLAAAQARIAELTNALNRKNDVIEGWRDECAEHADARATAEKRVAELEAALCDIIAMAAAKRELAGHDLACWCKLGEPCHADVLLKIANAGDEPAKE